MNGPMRAMELMRSHAAAILVAAVSLYAVDDARAQAGVEPCTGLPAPIALEQSYLGTLESRLARLSDGDASVAEELGRLVGYAEAKLQALRNEALVASLVFARAVDRKLDIGGGSVRAQPELVTAWARFRLVFSASLWAGDCLAEANELLGQARAWPIADSGISAGVIASHGATLIELGRLHEAIETLRPLLDAEGAPQSFTELRARFAASNNLGAALRQNGERTKAARIYQRALALYLDSASTALIKTPESRLTYESDLATVYLNLAALALYNQDAEQAWPYLQKARTALERAGQTESHVMVTWFRIDADYRMDIDDENAARESLREGLALAERVAPNSIALQSDLLLRLHGIGVADSAAIQQLLEIERELERREDADWNAKAKIAEALSEAFAELQVWDRAVKWARTAYGRMQAVSGGPTVELALTQPAIPAGWRRVEESGGWEAEKKMCS